MGMQKAIVAFVAALVSLLANFGFEVPQNILDIINAVVPVAGTLLVYMIPNSSTTTTTS